MAVIIEMRKSFTNGLAGPIIQYKNKAELIGLNNFHELSVISIDYCGVFCAIKTVNNL